MPGRKAEFYGSIPKGLGTICCNFVIRAVLTGKVRHRQGYRMQVAGRGHLRLDRIAEFPEADT
jgi:hypothetical protein